MRVGQQMDLVCDQNPNFGCQISTNAARNVMKNCQFLVRFKFEELLLLFTRYIDVLPRLHRLHLMGHQVDICQHRYTALEPSLFSLAVRHSNSPLFRR